MIKKLLYGGLVVGLLYAIGDLNEKNEELKKTVMLQDLTIKLERVMLEATLKKDKEEKSEDPAKEGGEDE